MDTEHRGIRGFLVGFVATVTASLVVLTAWLAVTGWQARSIATDLEGRVSTVTQSVEAGKFDDAAAALPEISARTGRLNGIVNSPPWSWLVGAGSVGETVASVGIIAAATDAAIAPLAGGGDIQAAASRVGADGSDAVDALAEIEPQLSLAAEAARSGAGDVESVNADAVLAPASELIRSSRARYLQLADALQLGRGAAQTLPTVMGFNGRRTWLVLLQNPSEARGTGGLIGAYAVVRVEKGRIHTITSDSNNSMNGDRLSLAGIPADTRRLWGDDLAYMYGFNLDRHFPYAATLAPQTLPPGLPAIDDVVSLDPEAVGALLALTGPVTAKGFTASSDNAVQFFTRDVYAQTNSAAEKDAVVVAMLTQVMDSFGDRPLQLGDMLGSLKPTIDEGRLLIASTDAQLQKTLEELPTSGVVPTAPGPWATVAVNDFAGSKMDAFLDTAVTYESASLCPAPGARSTLTITVTNNAPNPLFGYGTGRVDRFGGPPGSTKVEVAFYAPVGSDSPRFVVDGSEGAAVPGTSRNHPVWKRLLNIDRGQTRTFTAEFSEPYWPGRKPAVVAQPMVRDMATTVSVPRTCAG